MVLEPGQCIGDDSDGEGAEGGECSFDDVGDMEVNVTDSATPNAIYLVCPCKDLIISFILHIFSRFFNAQA